MTRPIKVLDGHMHLLTAATEREASAWLVHHLPRDLPSLCEALGRLDDAALAAQRRLTVPFLRSVFEAQSAGDD